MRHSVEVVVEDHRGPATNVDILLLFLKQKKQLSLHNKSEPRQGFNSRFLEGPALLRLVRIGILARLGPTTKVWIVHRQGSPTQQV